MSHQKTLAEPIGIYTSSLAPSRVIEILEKIERGHFDN
jgi:hypothetical protein